MAHKRNTGKVGFTHLFLCLILGTLMLVYPCTYGKQASPGIIDAHNHILKLQLSQGRSILNNITPNERSQGHYYYVKNLADIVELLLEENTSLYKEYNDREDDILKELKKMDDTDPYKGFYMAEIKLQWAMVKIQYGDELNGGMGLRSAWHTIQKNMEEFPRFNPNLKTMGLLHIIFGSTPDSYQWILKLLGIKGDVIKGMEELNQVSKSSPFWLEANIIKALVTMNILNKPDDATADVEKLLASHSGNMLLHYLHNVTLIKSAKSESALKNLTQMLFMGDEYLFLNMIYYQLGEIHIQKHDFARARLFYSKFLNDYKGENFVKDAWFKTAITYLLQDNEKLAEVHFEKADDTGKTFVSADKNADGILNENQWPNKALMKIRLATDGGYYENAESILSSLNENMFDSRKEKTKYYYRQARLKHLSQQKDKAIYFYLYTIKKAGNENWYYAPNACLQTGYIYQEKGEFEKARYYFEKALSYKKHKYKSEIDVKAETAISLLP